jgi:cold shock CspA family protein
MSDTDLADYELAADALEGSIFRMLRQGQRVVFDLDDAGRPRTCASAPRSTWQTPGA